MHTLEVKEESSLQLLLSVVDTIHCVLVKGGVNFRSSHMHPLSMLLGRYTVS